MLRFLIIFGLLISPAIAQEELQVTTPTAQEILKQIDGEVGEELSKRIEALKEDAAKTPPTPSYPLSNDLKPQKVITSELSDFALVLDFDANETTLSKAQIAKVVSDIPIKFQRTSNVRVQVTSFNNTAGISENENRRISLLRALEVRKALEAHNISYRNVDLMPMGRSVDKNQIEIRFTPI